MTKNTKNFLNRNTAILVGIFLLAYLLRTLPYLMGYNLPFTDDGMRDFDQVLYILENGRVNFFDHPFYFGSFPLLHLLTFFVSQLGFDPLKVFLFIPQIFPSLGLVFFYLFLKNYFSKKESLLAIFLIAIFGPHIHWSAQPVRETLGLFFFPLIFYLFDKIFSNFSFRRNYQYFIVLVVSFLLMVVSHHWSSLMLLLTLLVYSLIFITNKKSFYYASALLIVFSAAALFYWSLVFTIAYELIGKAINFSVVAPITTSLFLIFIIFIKKFKLRISLLKNNLFKAFYFIFISLLVFFVSFNFLPASYPVQILLPLIFYFFLFGLGFFYSSSEKINNFMVLNAVYVPFFVVAILYFTAGETIYSMPFDPFRTLEFAIFPSSIIIVYGLLIFKDVFPKTFLPITLILVFLATLVYPPLFVYGQRLENTIFYDVRSDVRHISTSSQDLIRWAHDSGFSIYSPRPEVKMYQRVFYRPTSKNLTLLSANDLSLKDHFNLINDPIIKVDYLPDWKYDINHEFVLVKHDGDYLVVPKGLVDLSNAKLSSQIDYKVMEFLKYFNKDGDGIRFEGQVYFDKLKNQKILDFNAEFVSQNFPVTKLKIGDYAKGTFIFRNSGNFTWKKDDDFFIKDQFNFNFTKLTQDVSPGEEAVFNYNSLVTERFATYSLEAQMYKEDFGYFGEKAPEIKIIYQQ